MVIEKNFLPKHGNIPPIEALAQPPYNSLEVEQIIPCVEEYVFCVE